MIELKKIYCDTFFDLGFFSGSAEFFIGYAFLQASLFSLAINSTRLNCSIYKSSLPNYHLVGIFISVSAFFLLLNEEIRYFVGDAASFNCMILNDNLGSAGKITVCFFVIIFFGSLKSVDSKVSLTNSFEYFSFLVSGFMGSLLICSSNDLITAYLSIELQSISFYLMACSKKNSGYSVESGLKYFIIGSFSSSFFLLGSAFVYLNCGSVNFTEMVPIQEYFFIDYDSINLGFFFIILSLLIKLAVAPFHLWSIDVYESSPSPTTYFFSVIPKIGLFIFLARIMMTVGFWDLIPNFPDYCLYLSITSILVGALGGLEQRKLKSLLAYSSVSHTGYALLSLSSLTEGGIVMMLCYLMFYMLSSTCFWFIFMLLKKRAYFYNKKLSKEIGDLAQLRKANPILALLLGIILFSLAGIPPLVGFFIKFGVFLSSVQTSAYLISLIAILFSVLSTFYYLRLIKVIFFENVTTGLLYYPIGSNKALTISLGSMLLVIMFIRPSTVYLIFLKSYMLIF